MIIVLVTTNGDIDRGFMVSPERLQKQLVVHTKQVSFLKDKKENRSAVFLSVGLGNTF